jgi:hypothetical protein
MGISGVIRIGDQNSAQTIPGSHVRKFVKILRFLPWQRGGGKPPD